MKTRLEGAADIKKTRINVVTLGCSKNTHDSEVLMGQLKGNKIEVVHEDEDVREDDIVIMNTCGLIDNAKQWSIDISLQYGALKDQGKIKKVNVTVSLSERYKPDLQQEIPNIYNYYGTNDLQELLQSVGADYKYEIVGERLLTTPSHFSYFKI